MRRIFKIILFAGILLIGFAALAIYWTFYRPLPDYSATVKLAQLHRPVQIKWDAYGVPHIYAKDKHDLYFSLGYVHARDRLWQMTLSQLAVQGRFAEFLGKDLLPLDKFQRTIGFWRIAKKMERRLPDSTRHILQAYAGGVNEYVKTHPKELPIQFSLTGVQPIRWTPTHTLALARLMAWRLNIAWKTELNYNLLYEKLSTAQFQELFPDLPIPFPSIPSGLDKKNSVDSSLSAAILPLLQNVGKYQLLMRGEGTHTGSNAWAVDGSKTSTGKPLLAGDPHLQLNLPGTWYEVHLNVNGKNLSGATLPGAPSVILGQNDVLAWSLTNVMLDDTDFFEEKTAPGDSSRYLIDSLAQTPVYKKFTVQHEIIKVKNGNDQPFTRTLTDHGPVISGIFPGQKKSDKIISMSWTGLQPSHEIEALQTMGWAQNFGAFQKGVKLFKSPAQNVIYADTIGNIGLFTAASVPIRKGNPVLLRPGWKPQMGWLGTVAYGDLPKKINPENGWVANANNLVASSDFPYYMSVYWQPDSRFQRIREYLNGNNKLGKEAFQVMQNDTYSNYARSVVGLILPVLKNSSDSSFATAIKYFQNWNYTYARAETAASIMDIFMLHLAENTLKDEMGGPLYTQFIQFSAKPARIIHRMLEDNSRFFDDKTTAVAETKADIIKKSMRQTIAFLKQNIGDEPANWHWQRLHKLVLNPPLLGRAAADSSASSALKLIVKNVLDKGPYAAGGNSMTINNGEYLWDDPFDMVVGASIRRIIDLSDTRQSLSVVPGGQSGNPLSDYYNDQTQSWLNGQYKFLMQDSSRFHRYKSMHLFPAK